MEAPAGVFNGKNVLPDRPDNDERLSQETEKEVIWGREGGYGIGFSHRQQPVGKQVAVLRSKE